MGMTVRYGVLGCGMMGQEHLRNLALIEGAQVVAIAEPDTHMQQRALKLAPGARMFSSLDELLDAALELDALVVATPNYQHAEQLLKLFERTSLPILIEKPIVTSLAQAEQIQAASERHPAPVWVAMEYRYMPPVAHLRHKISDGDLGDLKMLAIREHRFPFLEKVADWNRFNAKTGGTLVEKCCHFFDLMRLIIGSEATRVYASAAQDVNHVDERYDNKTPDIIDNALVIVDFANGKRASLDLCMFAEGSRYQEEICALGPEAKLECFVPGPGRFWPTETLGPAPVPKLIFSPRVPKGPVEIEIPVDERLLEAGDHNGSTFYQHQGFYNAVAGSGAVDVSLTDGIKAVVLGLAAQESARLGKAIRITNEGLSYQLDD